MCTVALEPMDFILDSKPFLDLVDFVGAKYCENKLDLGTDSYCEGSVSYQASQFIPPFIKGVLSPQRICDEILHLCKHPEITQLPADDFVEKLLAEKPAIIQDNQFMNNLYA